MKKVALLKKGSVAGIILLFICSSFVSSIGGYSEETNQVDTRVGDVCESQENVLVSCRIFGMPGEPSQEIAMPLDEAEFLYDKIKDLQIETARDPLSDKTQQLQHEIITFADEYNLLPAGVTAETFTSHLMPSRLPQHPKIASLPSSQNRASRFFCNYVSTGTGSALPVVIFPRLIPILLTPIPRLFVIWNVHEGVTSCGGLLSGTGFIAYGQQRGLALGFWGIGFSIFLPPVMTYGIFGYALFVTVTAENFEYYPPNSPPAISDENPSSGTWDVSLSLSELSFRIEDADGDRMSYSVTTDPDVGSGSGNLKPDGVYTVPISGLQGLTEYTWHVEVNDGKNLVNTSFTFTTEPVAPVVSDPSPSDGARYAPVDLSQLSFHLKDFQGDPMDYTVETSPDIGFGNAFGVGNGTYTVDVSGLDYSTEYTWYVNVTDGTHWTREIFIFQAEHKMVFDPFVEGWQYRKNITIDHMKVAGDLMNFPVLVSTVDSDLRDKAQPDGDDILFMDDSGVANRLYHEIEHFDGASGELIAWVNITSLSSTEDTVMYMYYGNNDCGNQENVEGTWDDSYAVVYHMDDATTSTVTDVTANNHDGTKKAANQPEEYSTGKIGKCQDYDDTDYIDTSNNPQNGLTNFTWSMWGYPHDVVGWDGWIVTASCHVYEGGKTTNDIKAQQGDAPDKNCYRFVMDNGAGSRVHVGTDEIFDNNWYYVTFVKNENDIYIYLNGNQDDSDTTTWDTSSITTNLRLGGYYWKSSWTYVSDGLLDEVRISNIARNSEWINTSYVNQNNPSSFLSFGPEESL